MAGRNRVEIASRLAMLGFCLAANAAIAGESRPAVDPALQRYLSCINGSAKQQQPEKSDRISNAQSVITSCASEKQALLKAMPDRRTAQIVARIEQHLKSREKPGS